MAGFFILLIILLILFALPIALSLGMIGLLSYIVGGHNCFIQRSRTHSVTVRTN